MTTRMVSLIFRPTGNQVPTRLSYPTRPSQNVLGCPSPRSVLGDFPVLAFLDQPLGNWEKRIIFPNFQLSLNFSQPPMEKTLQKTNGKMSCVSFPGKKSFDKKGWSFHILALLLMTSEGAKEESVDSSLVCLIQIDMAIFSKKLKGFKSQKVSSAANRSALLNPSRLYPAACRLLP